MAGSGPLPAGSAGGWRIAPLGLLHGDLTPSQALQAVPGRRCSRLAAAPGSSSTEAGAADGSADRQHGARAAHKLSGAMQRTAQETQGRQSGTCCRPTQDECQGSSGAMRCARRHAAVAFYIARNTASSCTLHSLARSDTALPACEPFATRWPVDTLHKPWAGFKVSAVPQESTETALGLRLCTLGQLPPPPARCQPPGARRPSALLAARQ